MADFKTIAASAVDFPDFVAQVVAADYGEAQEFMTGFHTSVDEKWGHYTNSQNFVSFRQNHQMPIPVIQQDVDTFVASVMQRVFYADRPIRVAARGKTGPEEADAKQALIQFQDGKDNIRAKFRRGVRDVALDRICVAALDWKEVRQNRYVEVQEMIPAFDAMGQPIRDEEGEIVPEMDEQGQPRMYEKRWGRREEIVYEGPEVKMIDPRNVFFCGDKREVDDEFPVMLRSYQSTAYFRSRPGYFNQDKLEEAAADSRGATGETGESGTAGKISGATAGRPHELIEWQGLLPKGKLYQYLCQKGKREDLEELEAGREYIVIEMDGEENQYRTIVRIDEHELVRAKVGVVMSSSSDTAHAITVEIEENPFGIDGPNLVIGTMVAEEDGMLALGLADRVLAVQLAQDELSGMLLHTFKASLDRGSVVNSNKILNPNDVHLNLSGWTIETNATNLDEVIKFFAPPDLSERIMKFSGYIERVGQDAGGMRDAVLGQGDKAANTLGEFQDISAVAGQRIADYLQSFEDSFIRPLYEKRNAMNCALIDRDYAVRVTGRKGEDWKQVSPGTIRAEVDFICEASTRENARAVITSQILQLAKIAPSVLAAGQPVRLDRLVAELCREGFLWNEEKVNAFLPLLKLEAIDGDDSFDRQLAENALLQAALTRLQNLAAAASLGGGPGGMAPGGSPGPALPGTGGPMPESKTEGEVVQSVNQSTRPQI